MTSGPREPGHHRRPTAALVASALVGPVLALVGLVLTWSVRDELPASIAVHWGLDGEPDRYASVAGAVATAAAMTALLPLLLVGLGAAMHPTTRGPLAGIAGALAVLLFGLSFGGLTAQRPGVPPQAFPTPWVLPTVLGAIAAGLALWWWGRVPPPPLDATRAPVPADAPRLDVPDTTRLAWTGRAALPSRGVVLVVVLALLPLLVVAVVGTPWVLLLVAALVALLVVTCSARVVVDADGLRVTSLFITWAHVPLRRVARADVTTVSPLREFGGWGWRIGRDGRRGFVTRGGEALVVERVGEPAVVVTVDDASEAAAVLNTLAARES
ncbi:DUF1648 domain-containing protein [Intrasporangium flavum]|uniref:DUF1648 domain-containing protein n=1 Tax=Intrasporangium flavum TaxID=1428657 RepID=UPI00096D683D|nr:DUF1648 domain-containing protein [Intrasporangium flavum]